MNTDPLLTALAEAERLIAAGPDAGADQFQRTDQAFADAGVYRLLRRNGIPKPEGQEVAAS